MLPTVRKLGERNANKMQIIIRIGRIPATSRRLLIDLRLRDAGLLANLLAGGLTV
ncbi:hypothetical protein COO91_08846 [Nostoc flagelliforme CCNUN1]|uniref:Uncharacterized protein n=1 Tax=Nostoc flagelliforme CCNUN1 TaxID=2038116 RepID=A0A2K8T500_9NOSO|nr:hypothetical protein COO91_08846 [Nostoc flagelliforme CCNUN1]